LGGEFLTLFLAIGFGAGVFLIEYLVSKGRWIGAGDIRVGAMMGAMLGFPLVILALFISYIIGAAFGILLIVFRKAKLKSEIPFGTFLTVGTTITLFYGDNILGWYLSRIGL
jgi:prepilin signal peptidase PulO-like enzyme (type II secretory pathway)